MADWLAEFPMLALATHKNCRVRPAGIGDFLTIVRRWRQGYIAPFTYTINRDRIRAEVLSFAFGSLPRPTIVRAQCVKDSRSRLDIQDGPRITVVTLHETLMAMLGFAPLIAIGSATYGDDVDLEVGIESMTAVGMDHAVGGHPITDPQLATALLDYVLAYVASAGVDLWPGTVWKCEFERDGRSRGFEIGVKVDGKSWFRTEAI